MYRKNLNIKNEIVFLTLLLNKIISSDLNLIYKMVNYSMENMINFMSKG